MNLLLLGEKSSLIHDFLLSKGHNIHMFNEKLDNMELSGYDFIISFGYRHIIKKNIIDKFPNKIINLHISLLPYNRGADPNLWSYLEDTPKGVTIHYIDENIDTGDILLQKEVLDDIEKDTLKTSYDRLINEMVTLFENNAENILNGFINAFQQPHNIAVGSEHKLKDKNKYLYLIEDKQWNTPVKKIIGVANKING